MSPKQPISPWPPAPAHGTWSERLRAVFIAVGVIAVAVVVYGVAATAALAWR